MQAEAGKEDFLIIFVANIKRKGDCMRQCILIIFMTLSFQLVASTKVCALVEL